MPEWIIYSALGLLFGILIGYTLGREQDEHDTTGFLIEEKNYETRAYKEPVTGQELLEETETENPLYFLQIKPERVKWIREKNYIRLKVIHLEDEREK